MTTHKPRILLSVLLNPPATTSGARTRSAVEAAAIALGYDSAEIVNLTNLATSSVLELNGHGLEHWIGARDELMAGLERASGLLGAWGTAGLSGVAREARRAQVEWLAARATQAGIDTIWTVGPRASHPSRWHQYVSDKHARTRGGSFSDRLLDVLTCSTFSDVAQLVPPVQSASHIR